MQAWPPSDRPLQTPVPAPGDPFLPSQDAPPSPHEVLQEHELRRRRRLVRIVALGLLVPVVLLIPSALIPSLDIGTLVALVIAAVGSGTAYLLNERQRVAASGFVVLGGVAVAIGWEIVTKASIQGGIDLGDLRLYDLFVLPILLSGVLISRRGPVIIALCTALFSIASLVALPHTPALQSYWDGTYTHALGSAYDVVAVAIVTQGLTAVASWLGADSVRRALLDATRAEELAAANQQIAQQGRGQEQQRKRLREAITNLQQVHAAISRGQWDARARVEESELAPVAMSLNLLLDRLSRLTRENEHRARLEHDTEELALALRRARAGDPYQPPQYSGTALDKVLVELAAMNASAASPSAQSARGGVRQSLPPTPAARQSLPPAPAAWPDDEPPNNLPAWLRNPGRP